MIKFNTSNQCSKKNLDVSLLSDDQVLFFIRIKGKASYFKNVYGSRLIHEFKGCFDYRTISEYRKDADVFINLKDIKRTYLNRKEYEVLDQRRPVYKIINACRGLRNISFTEALEYITKAYVFFDKFFKDNTNLKMIVSGPIDNYVTDIMVVVGEMHGVVFLGISNSFLSSEYRILNLRGDIEHTLIKEELSVEDIKKIICNKNKAVINKDYHTKFLARVFQNIKDVLKVIFRYYIMFKVFGQIGYEYRFAKQIKSTFKLRNIIHLLYYEQIKKLLPHTKKVYMPLHWFPEATTDYWVKDTFDVNYYQSLFDTIRLYQNNGWEVLVKEHPLFVFSRENETYNLLRNLGVKILSPYVHLNDLLSLVDEVVVWNGSVGIEALVLNKKVSAVIDNYYGCDVLCRPFQGDSHLTQEQSVETILAKLASITFKAVM